MTWDAYISDQLLGSGNVKEAAIIGHDGNTWANSAGFTISQDEATKMVAAFTSPDDMRASGMYVAGKKFFFLSNTEDVLRGKKEKQGIHVAKTSTAIIVAVYEEPIQPGQAATTVESLADYFRSVNY